MESLLSLKHAILVMLDQKPHSGYDLLQQFKESVGYFWNAKHQQIYRQLKILHDEELIAFQSEIQSGKPDKKIYAITQQGKDELLRWLKEPVATNKINDALLVKIYGADSAPIEDIASEIERHIEIHQNTLNYLLALEKKYLSLSSNEQLNFRYPYLTLRRGILGEEAWLRWAEEATQLFKK
ncbi:hypothetical protein A3762_13340 [Oleiphilus sp. HI0125]|nr:hypothetical protein A3762_13340 [Oleiphilus sp. HI0125]